MPRYPDFGSLPIATSSWPISASVSNKSIDYRNEVQLKDALLHGLREGGLVLEILMPVLACALRCLVNANVGVMPKLALRSPKPTLPREATYIGAWS
jgi:hypothetical protein